MAKPTWVPTLAQVLQHKTERVTLHSERTGNDYETEIIPRLDARLVSINETDTDSAFKYSIIDELTNLEFEIKVIGKKLDAPRFSKIAFKEVRGGATSRGGWYSAKSVHKLTAVS